MVAVVCCWGASGNDACLARAAFRSSCFSSDVGSDGISVVSVVCLCVFSCFLCFLQCVFIMHKCLLDYLLAMVARSTIFSF
jgi:hypothetical protein